MNHSLSLVNQGLLTLLALFTISTSLGAQETIRFDQFWSMVEAHSSRLKASQVEELAARIEKKQAQLHWFPSVYARGSLSVTNDPAMTFFSRLNQREVRQTDFDPASLNKPGDSFFQNAAIGADLPLFEGGAKWAYAQATRDRHEATALSGMAAKRIELSEALAVYGQLIAFIQARGQYAGLSEGVEKIIARYQVGEESNPVGFSGLLGLKGLRNRVLASLAHLSADQSAAEQAMNEMTGRTQDAWKIESVSYEELFRPFPIETEQESFQIRAATRMAAAAEKRVLAERARILPRVGLFVEESLSNGNRDFATAYVGGLYLQWRLSAPDAYASRQAQAEAVAQKSRVELARQQESIRVARARETLTGLNETLRHLDESEKLLARQTAVAFKLFRNGRMNALQLAEVLNRRADLIDQSLSARSGWLQAKALLVQTHGRLGE